jgi:hypothetical protein
MPTNKGAFFREWQQKTQKMETAKLSTDTNAHVSSTSNTCAGTRKLISSNYKNDTYDTHESATMGNESHADGISIYSANTFRKLCLQESTKNVLKIATINMKTFMPTKHIYKN